MLMIKPGKVKHACSKDFKFNHQCDCNTVWLSMMDQSLHQIMSS